MKLFLVAAVLPFMSQAENPKCYTGGVADMTKDEFLDMMHQALGASVVNVVSSVPGLKNFLKTRGTCQAICFESIMKPTMATVLGKMGKKLNSEEGKTMAIEAMTGAFRACYPSPPRDDIKKLATEFADSMGQPPKESAEFPQGVTCENQEHANDFPQDEASDTFKDTFEKVISAKPKVLKFFQTKALNCQFPCLEATIPITLKTAFLTGKFSDRKLMTDALTGSMHACFPGVPSHAIRELVSEVLGELMKVPAAAASRLYASNMIKWGSSNFFTLCGIFTASTLLLFSAGVTVGRLWKRSSCRQVTPEDSVGLIEIPIE